MAALTPADTERTVAAVRRLAAEGKSLPQIAAALGFSYSYVGLIARRYRIHRARHQTVFAKEPATVLTRERALELYAYQPDGTLVRRVARGHQKVGDVAGCMAADGYLTASVDKMRLAVHHIVWVIHHDEMPSQIDHINGVRHDNRIENLRIATPSQNCANRTTKPNQPTPFKGVSRHGGSKKFQVTCGGVYIGVFAAAEEAAAAYDRAALAKYGEFARTNADLGLLSEV